MKCVPNLGLKGLIFSSRIHFLCILKAANAMEEESNRDKDSTTSSTNSVSNSIISEVMKKVEEKKIRG